MSCYFNQRLESEIWDMSQPSSSFHHSWQQNRKKIGCLHFQTLLSVQKTKITSRTGDKKAHCRHSKTRAILSIFLDHGVAVHHKEALPGQTISQHFTYKYCDVPLVQFVWKWESSKLQIHLESVPANLARLLWILLVKHSASVVYERIGQIRYEKTEAFDPS